MKVLVLTAIENPLPSSLVYTQTILPAKLTGKAKIVSLVHPRDFFLRRIKRPHGVWIFPLLYPLRYRDFHLGAIHIPFFILFNLPIFLFVLLLTGPSLVHARSYPASLLAWLGSFIFPYRFLFDPRGRYPEEGLMMGRFRKRDYKIWKRLERLFIKRAWAKIGVSMPHVRELGERTIFIPPLVDTQKFTPGKKKKRKKWVVVHLGNFGHLSDCELVAKLASSLRAFLYVLHPCPENFDYIKEVLEREGVKEYEIKRVEREEVVEYLREADLGTLLEEESLTTPIAMGTKLPEYLACGVPVVVTPYVRGAVEVVEKYECGVVVDPEREKPKIDKKEIERMRERARRCAEEVFSLKRGVEKLRRLYEGSLPLTSH